MRDLPKDCYMFPDGSEQISNETELKHSFDKLELTPDGVLVHFEDCTFPYRDFVTYENLFAINQVKAVNF